MGWLILLGYSFFALFWGVLATGFVALVRWAGRHPSRALPLRAREELAAIPEAAPGVHVVDLELHTGRRVRGARIEKGRFPSTVGGRTVTQRYRATDVVHVYPHVREPVVARLLRHAARAVPLTLTGGAIGVLRHLTETEDSVKESLPTGLGVASLFVFIRVVVGLVDWWRLTAAPAEASI